MIGTYLAIAALWIIVGLLLVAGLYCPYVAFTRYLTVHPRRHVPGC